MNRHQTGLLGQVVDYREGDESVEEAEQADHQEDLEEGDEDVGLRGR